jgi:hypothetical protein
MAKNSKRGKPEWLPVPGRPEMEHSAKLGEVRLALDKLEDPVRVFEASAVRVEPCGDAIQLGFAQAIAPWRVIAYAVLVIDRGPLRRVLQTFHADFRAALTVNARTGTPPPVLSDADLAALPVDRIFQHRVSLARGSVASDSGAQLDWYLLKARSIHRLGTAGAKGAEPVVTITMSPACLEEWAKQCEDVLSGAGQAAAPPA